VEQSADYSIRRQCRLAGVSRSYVYYQPAVETEKNLLLMRLIDEQYLRHPELGNHLCRDKRIPLYYSEYEGNRHDSKVFLQIMEDMFSIMHDSAGEKGVLTVVFDKGMNSEDNITAIDSKEDINFITTYSPYFAEHLIHVGLDNFIVVDTVKNRKLTRKGKEDDRLLAWRTQGEYWGRERTVVVTYNPLTATKQRYAFEKKMPRLQGSLFEFQSKVNNQPPYWRKQSVVLKRYKDICSELHIPSDLYKVELYSSNNRLRMNFRQEFIGFATFFHQNIGIPIR